MSTISDLNSSGANAANQSWNAGRAAQSSGTGSSASALPKAEARDTVTISDEARGLYEGSKQSPEPMQQEIVVANGLEPTKTLKKGSVEEKEFKELLESLKNRKSDVMGRVESLLKEAGISLKDQGKLKLEVDSSGKIRAGGLKDDELAKKVEEALNKDKSLGRDMRKFQQEEKLFSGKMKEYTGCTLYELTMTAKGDINPRIREAVEGSERDLSDSYYTSLAFLGDLQNSVASLSDVQSLSFTGSIDFSGEVGTIANAEETVTDAIRGVNQNVKDKFDSINNDFLATLQEKGIDIDQELMETHLLDITKVNIRIDNLGGVEIEGMLCGDQMTHDKGVEIIRGFVRDMLQDTENSYHINEFTEASASMISDMANEAGLTEDEEFDSRVVTEIRNGTVLEAKVKAPQAEARMVEDIQSGVNEMIESEGFALSGPLEIEVDDDGAIRATNLEEVTDDPEAVKFFLDQLNARLETAKPTGDEESETEKTEEESLYADWESGIQALADQLANLETLRRG